MPNQRTKRAKNSSAACPPETAASKGRDGKFQEYKEETGPQRGSVKQDAKDVANEVRETARSVKQSVKEQASEVAEGTRRQATEQFERVKTASEDTARDKKDRVADEAESISHAAHDAADTLREENDEMMAHYVERAAEGCERVSRFLRDREPRQLLRDVEDLSRSRPELMFGSLFVAGLGIARFLKASGARRRAEERSTQLTTPQSFPTQQSQSTQPSHSAQQNYSAQQSCSTQQCDSQT